MEVWCIFAVEAGQVLSRGRARALFYGGRTRDFLPWMLWRSGVSFSAREATRASLIGGRPGPFNHFCCAGRARFFAVEACAVQKAQGPPPFANAMLASLA